MSSPAVQPSDGMLNPGYVNSEGEQRSPRNTNPNTPHQHSPIVVPISGPPLTPGSIPHPFLRAQTDTSLLSTSNNTLPVSLYVISMVIF